jgi:hypothetical protein
MAADPVFTITYWGVTGSLSAPLRPPEVTDKVVAAIRHLVEHGRLADLRPGPDLEAAVRSRVEELPFHLRSAYGGNTTCVEVQTPDALLIWGWPSRHAGSPSRREPDGRRMSSLHIATSITFTARPTSPPITTRRIASRSGERPKCWKASPCCSTHPPS